jgi:ubiquinone/menaquinone biosynthesis C-methylase UbiE
LWQTQLACAQDELLKMAALAAGEQVLDVACGTGLVALNAALMVGPNGRLHGIDLSGQMIAIAERTASEQGVANASFERMDAEFLTLPDASFDVVLCALGLMYLPEPERAVREMRRVLRPGGRLIIAVWGERSRCGWSALFPIVDSEVSSEVCPLFFRFGQGDALAQLCLQENFALVESRRIDTKLNYSDLDAACAAAFIGGPVALAWSRFDEPTRARVCARYKEAIEPWRNHHTYQIPGEFVIVSTIAE